MADEDDVDDQKTTSDDGRDTRDSREGRMKAPSAWNRLRTTLKKKANPAADGAVILAAYRELPADKQSGVTEAYVGSASSESTLLHFVSEEGSVAGAKALVEELHADVNATNKWNWTPLHFAVRNNHATLAAYLLEHGADGSVKSTRKHGPYPIGTTPVDMARLAGTAEIQALFKLPGATAAVELVRQAEESSVQAAAPIEPVDPLMEELQTLMAQLTSPQKFQQYVLLALLNARRQLQESEAAREALASQVMHLESRLRALENTAKEDETTDADQLTPAELASLTTCRANDFAIQRVGGYGDFGAVFIASCTKFQHPAPASRLYAMKAVYPNGATSSTVRNSMLVESLVLSRLPSHPHIVRYIGQFVDRIPASWMTFVPDDVKDNVRARDSLGHVTDRLSIMQFVLFQYYAGSLKDKLGEIGQLPERRQALQWAAQVGQALLHLQAHHIVHRDVKLDNILLGVEDRVVLCDFGMALQFAPGSWEATFASAGDVGGNEQHQPPEVLAAKHQLLSRAGSVQVSYAHQAVFELGVVLYELATGDHPIEGYPLALLASLGTDGGVSEYKSTAIARLPDAVGAELQECAIRMVAYHPTARPELAEAVRVITSAAAKM